MYPAMKELSSMVSLTGEIAHIFLPKSSLFVRGARALIIALGFGLIITLAPRMTAAPPQNAQQPCQAEPRPGCRDKARFDLAFIVDASGSIAKRGQSFNIEIEGIARAARNPTIIPPDGSISLAVITFDETAFISIPLMNIKSADDAEMFASRVKNLKPPSPGSQDGSSSFGTNYTVAIDTADNHLNQNRRPDARRILLMSSDGEPTDASMGVGAANRASNRAAAEGLLSELDAILIGVDTEASEFPANKAKLDRIVFSRPTDEMPDQLPGATLIIKGGECTKPDATPGGADCDRQADEFAVNVRKILRSHVPAIKLVVTTEVDSLQPAAIGNQSPSELSLRQAIELANCNQGSATITFAETVKGKTIRLVAPLPALTAPDITIDGCDQGACGALVTVDGSLLTSPLTSEDQSDGILVRSNHDRIRGLRIINFKRAGIAVASLCQFDFTGHNLIELNTIENNGRAGVIILDPSQQASLPNLSSKILHNTGNTISRNTILQSAAFPDATGGKPALIDMGGDGPTLNDPGDGDEGPNRLLNYPEPLTVVNLTVSATANFLHTSNLAPAAGPVAITGKAAANATVEIYAVTNLRTSDCSVVIIGVIYLTTVDTDARGDFTAAGIPMSPTGAYTAAATDSEGNTSEFQSPCAGTAQAQITLEDNQAELKFDPLSAASKNKKPINLTPKRFRIQNVGCSPLEITDFKILRDAGMECPNNNESCLSDAKYFSISRIISAGPPLQEEPVFTQGRPIIIAPGRCQDFLVRFNPIVPAVTSANSNHTAEQVLPDAVISKIEVGVNSPSANPVKLVGQVKTAVKLINPNKPNGLPLVSLTRSGNELTATYYIYDSNLDVDTAEYKFFDGGKTEIQLEPMKASLKEIILERKVLKGQSFAVVQRFTNANEHPETSYITVTVSDGETSAFAKSGAVVVSTGTANAASVQNSQGATVVLPKARLSPHRSKQRKKYE
jgi:uncharacterized protein YegL